MNKNESTQTSKKLSPSDSYWIPVSPGITGLGIKIFRRLRRYYRQWFQNRNHIFMISGPFEPVVDPPCEFARYESFDDIPDPVKNAMLLNDGEKRLETDRFEMNNGASMWAGFVDGQLASRMLIRSGKNFKKWFVDLNENDIVLFGAKTYPEYRGRGIINILNRYSMYTLLHNGGKAYLDININNISSIRAVQKIGAVKIATMKPITNKQALGIDE